ncbi:MAG: selenium-dependent molybdenum cofactor biosynthesis protein YqeB [Acidimicrobiales bacterium]|nr:selenium-dependent molybdenum cofactor biosynthesis protein YqeB [Acidimicrobiales bacterium]
MLFEKYLCLLRGGGDLATGVALRLHRAGFPVAVCELERPLTVRRTVALSTALTHPSGVVSVEGMTARRVKSFLELCDEAATGVIPVVVSPDLPTTDLLPRSVVVDARLLKRNPDTSLDDAPLVIALGPGYTAGRDCHVVVETLRGPDLGRVIVNGRAATDTGTPGTVGGHSTKRVLRAPADGEAQWVQKIGNRVSVGELLGHVGDTPVVSTLDGVIRGLVADGTPLELGTKIGDVDTQVGVLVNQISDKALAVGGGALEAVMTWVGRNASRV